MTAKASFDSISAILDETRIRKAGPPARTPEPPQPAPPRADAPKAARPRSAASTGGVRPLPFRAPLDTVEALRIRARTDRSSQPNVILDAIEANIDRLDELLHGGRQTDPTDGGLFRRLAPPVSQDTVPITVRVTAQALGTIDDLVAKHNAPSRTALIVAALNAHLDGTAGSPPGAVTLPR